MDDDFFLPGLPVESIRAAYIAAPGNEIASGKFTSLESSAALVANAFGLFLENPASIPSLPGTSDCGWPAETVKLEAVVRLPWSGGHHPCLDVLIATRACLIGIESKRYEPFRLKKRGEFSDAYWRDVWGERMAGYQRCRDCLHDDPDAFAKLDATQLVKHAFGLRTAINKVPAWQGKQPILYYLFAEPAQWPDGRTVPPEDRRQHRAEIKEFADMVAGNEVSFRTCTYSELLTGWEEPSDEKLRTHALAVTERFLL
jgi:hypothetical protein